MFACLANYIVQEQVNVQTQSSDLAARTLLVHGEEKCWLSELAVPTNSKPAYLTSTVDLPPSGLMRILSAESMAVVIFRLNLGYPMNHACFYIFK